MANKRAPPKKDDGAEAKRTRAAAPGKGLVTGASVTPAVPEGYMAGFGSHFVSEAIVGALPKGMNNPQRAPFGLYAEQLTGTAFTAPRASNQRSWLYRIRPSVVHGPLAPTEEFAGVVSDFGREHVDPNQMRWMPQAYPETPTNFLQGIVSLAGAGEPTMKAGLGVHLYACTADMGDTAFYNSDGDMLIVPQEGRLRVTTELGVIDAEPCEIVLVQRGIKFSVALPDGRARGYICELFDGHFKLPDLGPIGSNGLANPRDFLTPVAAFEDRDAPFKIVNKFGGKFFVGEQGYSPFNVVAWHGNYAPCKYDLRLFNCMNSVTYDHPDPSIYTVLTCQTAEPGVAACDFVIFPPRWMVMEGTFRPPWYHRNCMSEFMGMIWGEYDAKAAGKGGFVAGGGSLHSCMTPHGPDAKTFLGASTADLQPAKFDKGLAFMFESTYMLKLTRYALDCPQRDRAYQECWQPLPKVYREGTADATATFEELVAAGAGAGAGAGAAGEGAAKQ